MAFNDLELMAEAQHVTTGLLVQLLSDEEGIKYVQSKLYINTGLVRNSMQKLPEAAYPICDAGFLESMWYQRNN